MSVTATVVPVAPDSQELQTLAERMARRHTVPAHEVLVRLLLELPCHADAAGMVQASVAEAQSERVAAELAAATAEFPWQRLPVPAVTDVRSLHVVPVDQKVARIVLERFHYLRSFRSGSEHLGGVTSCGNERRLAALLTFSPLDLTTIAERLPDDVQPYEVAVLSRVFAFDWAPRNTLSFVMARALRELRGRSYRPRMLVTYLNPNVGFSGASYRASNWMLWARETGTRYAYVEGRYATDRELQRRFGTADPDLLRGRVVFSSMPLRPLDLYAYPLDPHLREVLGRADPIELSRPMP